MKLNKLNWKVLSYTAVFGVVLTASSCNNNDDSGNNSTVPDTASVMPSDTNNMMPSDTSHMMNSDSATMRRDSTNKGTGKRSGRVSINIPAASTTDKMASDKMGYYNYAEVSPSFRGGQSAIESYINNNIAYPQDAIDNNMEGTVSVRFGIDEKGNVSNAKIVGNKIGYGLDEEAVRVISGMTKWTPGQVKGKNVKTWMVLPITYRIEG